MLTALIASGRYTGPTRQKLAGPILQAIFDQCLMNQRKFLEQRTGYGRSVAGDGATIQGTKYINFLAHEYTKGHMLAGLTDCTERLTDVGSVQATFIAHHWIGAIRFALFCL